MNEAFLTVLNMSVTGGMIIAVLIIVRFFLKRMPRRYSYALWLIPAIRLLCPVSISSVVSVFNLFKPKVTESHMDYIPEAPLNYYITPSPAPAPTVPSVPSAPSVTPSIVVDSPAAVNLNPNSFGIRLIDVVSLIWIIGAAAIILWCVISYISVLRRVRGSEKCGDYYICKNMLSPFVFGIINPKIYLPDGLPENDVRCIIAHEKAHIKRRDYIVKLLTVPILALHWFNPLVWLGIKLMSTDMELSCDEHALLSLSPDFKKDYANALLNISMRQNGISFSGLLGFGESGIKTRIKGVLRMKKPKLWATVAAFAVVIVAAVCLLTNAIANAPEDLDIENIANNEIDGSHDLEEPEISDEEILALLNSEAEIDRYINYGAMECRGGTAGTPEYPEKKFYKCSEDDKDEWSEWEAYIRTVYCGEAAESVLNSHSVVNIDGFTYNDWDGGPIEYEFTDEFSLTKQSADDNSAVYVVSNPYTNGYGNAAKISTYTFEKIEEGWRISSVGYTLGYKLNQFVTGTGHLADNGDVDYISNDDPRVLVSFALSDEWNYREGGTASDDISKVFEIAGVFPTEEYSVEKVSYFDIDTSFPATFINVMGRETTVYEEAIGDNELYDYMEHTSSMLNSGNKYESYTYVVSRNGWSVYVTFVVNENFDETVVETVLRSVNMTTVADDSTSKISLEEAERLLFEHLADDPNIGWSAYLEPAGTPEQEIEIKDWQGFHTETVYVFSSFFNDELTDMDGRWYNDYAISLDGKKVYWYDAANDWHIDYDDLEMYNPSIGDWTEGPPASIEYYYELDGRISVYPIVLGRHEHSDCDDSNAELIALGQQKLNDAVKIFKVLSGLAPRDMTKEYIGEYAYEEYNALDEGFGNYESIMELRRNTFAPDMPSWRGYYSVEYPDELLVDSPSAYIDDDGNYVPVTLDFMLGRSLLVKDGVTYLTVSGIIDGHTLGTKITGVISHSDTHIEYRLCTMILDESDEALAVSEEIPQVFFEHSIMKLELIGGEWLITQIRDELGNETPYNETFIANNGLEF